MRVGDVRIQELSRRGAGAICWKGEVGGVWGDGGEEGRWREVRRWWEAVWTGETPPLCKRPTLGNIHPGSVGLSGHRSGSCGHMQAAELRAGTHPKTWGPGGCSDPDQLHQPLSLLEFEELGESSRGLWCDTRRLQRVPGSQRVQ